MPHRPYDHLAVCGDWRVEQSVELMERNFSRPFKIQELARRLGSSLRELNRAAALAGDDARLWARLSQGYQDAGDAAAATRANLRAKPKPAAPGQKP